jgi:ATP/maltotriose-dependent transcriptional regulator MalT
MAKLTLAQKVKNALDKEASQNMRFYHKAMDLMDKADTDVKVAKVLDKLINDKYWYADNLYVVLGDLHFSTLKRTSKGK